MIIIKFAMIFFLITMTLLLTQRQGEGPLVGGPYYFLDMPGNRNPTKPSLRLNGWKAFHSRNVWHIWFDASGRPVDMRLFRDGVQTEREQLYWDKNGRLWRRVWS
jgi:hypothetical protein